MQKFEFTVERAFTAVSKQSYSVMAESRDEAIKMFTTAFENCEDSMLRDGPEIVSDGRVYSPKATGRLVGDDEFYLEMDFDADPEPDESEQKEDN